MASIFESNPTNGEYYPLPDKQIALVAGYPNITGLPLDEALCKKVAECGFNITSATLFNDDYIEQSLINCQKNGLKLYVHNERLSIEEEALKLKNKFSDYEGLGGWILSLDISEQEIDLIKEEDKAKNEGDKNLTEEIKDKHNVLIGLSGDWNHDRNGPYQCGYPNYIAKFQKKFNPAFWAFSYFPDIKDGDNERYLNFYKTIQYFAYISRYTASPFWVFCRCQGFKVNGIDKAPAPTLQGLRGFVFASLAYGAQGIYYWNYRQNQNIDSEYPTVFNNAPIDYTGNETAVWDMVKKVNEEVKGYNEIFFGCEMVDCRHITDLANPKWLKIMKYPIGPLEKIERTLGGDILISHIFNNDKNYLVVIYNPFGKATMPSLPDPLIPEPKITSRVELTFNPYWKVYRVSSTDRGLVESVPFSPTAYNLNDGDYLIFRWE